MNWRVFNIVFTIYHINYHVIFTLCFFHLLSYTLMCKHILYYAKQNYFVEFVDDHWIKKLFLKNFCCTSMCTTPQLELFKSEIVCLIVRWWRYMHILRIKQEARQETLYCQMKRLVIQSRSFFLVKWNNRVSMAANNFG